MEPLPIGISTLKMIQEENFTYVDKTGILLSLALKPGRFFLFRNLAIHDKWDWSIKYPVVKIDFAGGILRSKEDFENKIIPVLDRIASMAAWRGPGAAGSPGPFKQSAPRWTAPASGPAVWRGKFRSGGNVSSPPQRTSG